MHDNGVANLYFLSISAGGDKRCECLYVHYVHSSGYPYGLIVCRLDDGSFLAYNDGEIGKRLHLVDANGQMENAQYVIKITPIAGGPAEGEAESYRGIVLLFLQNNSPGACPP